MKQEELNLSGRVRQVFAQFKEEEAGNRVTQFNTLALENFVVALIEEDKKNQTDPQVKKHEQQEGDSQNE